MAAPFVALALGSATLAAERVVLERKSAYNSIVVTDEDGGLRVLRFERGGARQSVVKLGDPEHLELPYTRLVPIGLALVDQPQRVLVIGLGGGTLPALFRKKFPRLAIDSVDIDPEVVAVAKSHFGYRDDERMQCYVDDGRRFIAKYAARYDLIVLDAFGADSVPYALSTREFLGIARKALTAKGIMVSNIWGSGANPLFESMVRTYQATFDGVTVLDVDDSANKIVISVQGRALPREALIDRARAFRRLIDYRYDLGALVERGLQHGGAYGRNGKVLTDDSPPR